MKLKVFNTENIKSGSRATIATLNVIKKGGHFSFSVKAAELIGLNDGDQVAFFQDEEDEDCWYVQIVKDHGFAVRFPKSKNSTGLMFTNSSMARSILGDSSKQNFLIAGQPTIENGEKLWGLLIRPNRS